VGREEVLVGAEDGGARRQRCLAHGFIDSFRVIEGVEVRLEELCDDVAAEVNGRAFDLLVLIVILVVTDLFRENCGGNFGFLLLNHLN